MPEDSQWVRALMGSSGVLIIAALVWLAWHTNKEIDEERADRRRETVSKRHGCDSITIDGVKCIACGPRMDTQAISCDWRTPKEMP